MPLKTSSKIYDELSIKMKHAIDKKKSEKIKEEKNLTNMSLLKKNNHS